MHETIKYTSSIVFKDRAYLLLILAIILSGLWYVIYCLLSVHYSDTQVITHYSGLGETHFYKDRWYSLYSYLGFGVLAIVFNVGLLLKLHRAGYRHLGILFGIVAVIVMLISLIYLSQVLYLAFL